MPNLQLTRKNKKNLPHEKIPLAKRDYISGGQGWIRTTVLSREQIYSLSPLATRPPTHI